MNIIQPPVLEIDMRCKRKISPNGALERRIVWNLIAFLEARDFRVYGIWDGEEFVETSDAKTAMEYIFNLDEASLRVVSRSVKSVKNDWHGIYLVLGNGEDIISDWNYFKDDRDGFNAVMESFEVENYF